MEKSNMIVFSVTPSRVENAVAIVRYAVVTGEEEQGRGLRCVVCDVTWNGGAPQRFREATLREVPVELRYVRGEVPAVFAPWQRVGCEVRDISEYDASFERFWNVYGNKMGAKSRVAKKWEKLEWEERVLAIGSIPRLRNYYVRHGYDMPYPETYLDQRRWENIMEG